MNHSAPGLAIGRSIPRGRTTRRQGAVLAMALVTLLVVGLIAGLVVERLLAGHRQMRREADQLQAEWLAEAAIARGWRLRQANAEFTEEEWRAAGGVATIRVGLPPEEVPGVIRIQVAARYPDHPTQRALVERTYLLPLAAAGAATN